MLKEGRLHYYTPATKILPLYMVNISVHTSECYHVISLWGQAVLAR